MGEEGREEEGKKRLVGLLADLTKMHERRGEED